VGEHQLMQSQQDRQLSMNYNILRHNDKINLLDHQHINDLIGEDKYDKDRKLQTIFNIHN
jgi:hypothetical protein